jgi:hypothetical protein
MVAIAVAVAIAIAIAISISVVVPNSITIAVAVACCRCRWPLPLWLPSTVTAAPSVALPSAIAIAVVVAVPVAVAVAMAVTLTIGHCCLCHRWPLQLPSPLAITVTVAIGLFQVLLPWHGKNCIWPIEAKNAPLILFCLDSGRHTDQGRMTDQVWSGNGQHQHWVASSKQWVASEGSGWQQGGSKGGSRVEMLTDHGMCCFVVLLGYQLLTNGVCYDVLDMVEGITGETMIKLMGEEKGIKEIYDLDKNMYTLERIRKMWHIGLLDVPKSIAGETTMKMTHKEVGICRRYVCHKEMCIKR